MGSIYTGEDLAETFGQVSSACWLSSSETEIGISSTRTFFHTAQSSQLEKAIHPHPHPLKEWTVNTDWKCLLPGSTTYTTTL